MEQKRASPRNKLKRLQGRNDTNLGPAPKNVKVHGLLAVSGTTSTVADACTARSKENQLLLVRAAGQNEQQHLRHVESAGLKTPPVKAFCSHVTTPCRATTSNPYNPALATILGCTVHESRDLDARMTQGARSFNARTEEIGEKLQRTTRNLGSAWQGIPGFCLSCVA